MKPGDVIETATYDPATREIKREGGEGCGAVPCSLPEETVKTCMVEYLSAFLGGQRGFTAPVSDQDRIDAKEMAVDMLEMMKANGKDLT